MSVMHASYFREDCELLLGTKVFSHLKITAARK